MNLQDAIKQEDNSLKTYTDKLVELLENTIITKTLFNQGKQDKLGNNLGWDEAKKRFGEFYLNPNFSLFSKSIYDKMDEHTDFKTDKFHTAIRQAVGIINEKCGKRVLYVEPIKNTIIVRWIK